MALALVAPFIGAAMATEVIDQPAGAQSAAPAVQKKDIAATDPTLAANDKPAAAAETPSAPAATTVPGYDPALNILKKHAVFFDVNVGTMGLGMDIGYQFNPYLKARVRGGLLHVKRSFDMGSFSIGNHIADQIGGDLKDKLEGQYGDLVGDALAGITNGIGNGEVSADLEIGGNNYGFMLDYHPFAGHFHLTVGVNYMDLYVDAQANLTAVGAGGKVYEFGDDKYCVLGDTGSVGARCSWDKLQPYVGLGWSSDPSGKYDVFCSFEMGVNFIGSGNIKTRLSDNVMVDRGGNSGWQPASTEILDESLHKEAKEVYDIADKLIIWPVIQIGVGCRF